MSKKVHENCRFTALVCEIKSDFRKRVGNSLVKETFSASRFNREIPAKDS